MVALVLDARRPPLGDGRGWLGLTWSPTHDVHHVGPLGADLAGGALGPALLLAEYATLSGERDAAAACVEALHDLQAVAGSPLGDRLEGRFELNAWPLGGVAGPGALLHVAARAAPHLGAPALAEIVRAQLDRATRLLSTVPFGLGLATGLAGLQVQLLGARHAIPSAAGEIDDLVRGTSARLERALLDTAERAEPPDVEARLSRVLPAGRDGVALAVASALAADMPLAETTATAATAALSRHASEPTFGGRLAALSIHGAAAISSCSPTAPATSLATVSTAQLLAHATLWQRVVQLDDDEGHALQRDLAVLELLDRRQWSGRWFPDRLVDDHLHLSALDGLSALGRVLVRQLEPSLSVLSVA
ncbi:MAG TPA: hypothetical protein VKT18_05800, partial [Acidimicrobiales bacterium]|nr:hypothetical protein [Acidimicrobiales bacterium]